MEDSTIREYKISFLQHEYNRYSTIIYNLMRHIESIYKDGFIQHKQRLASLNSLNQLIKYMNQVLKHGYGGSPVMLTVYRVLLFNILIG